jgi:hypothetical protein
LRSVSENLKFGNVWVVGGKPDWYKGNHISVAQSGNKYANGRANLRAVVNCSDITDEFVFINDADEFILPKDRQVIIDGMRTLDRQVGYANVIDYITPYTAYPLRPHKPTVAVRPSVKFYEVRNARGDGYFPDVYMHHFGYALPKKDVDWKLADKKWYGVDFKNMETLINQSPRLVEPPRELLEILGEK